MLPRDVSFTALCDAMRAIVGGYGLVPVEVLRSLAAGAVHEGTARPLSDDEIGWLRQLADGVTVGRLAEWGGYSERMMFRLLAELYGRLGAENRTKALMRPRDEGWL
ncbi:hypothetical protein [Spirillospora sp. NPDC047279]|uniref:hypothetical protein n=1 Tax=Spirillospora sp. NPDC047279 TaxID=3155478 RepID=UPI0033DAFD10